MADPYDVRARLAEINRNPILRISDGWGPDERTALERSSHRRGGGWRGKGAAGSAALALDASGVAQAYTALSGAQALDLAATGAISDGWTPLNMSPTAYLEGDDAGLIFSGFSWPNPGSGPDFSQGTAARKPIAGTINARQAVDFDGSDDRCAQASGTTATFVNATSYWCSGVVRLDTLRTAAAVKDYTATPIILDSNAAFGVFAYYDGTRMVLYAQQFTGGGNKVTPDAVANRITAGTPFYFEAYYDSSLNRMGCRKDNGADQTLNAPGNLFATNGVISLACETFSLAGWDGAIGSLVLLNSQPSATEAAAWRQWCATRWGVTTP